MIARSTLCLVVLGPLISEVACPGVDYYVDAAGGNDRNTGRGAVSAWKSIGKVNAYTGFAPGDRVLLRRGQVWREPLIVPASGVADRPIVFGAYGDGQPAGAQGLDPGRGLDGRRPGRLLEGAAGCLAQPGVLQRRSRHREERPGPPRPASRMGVVRRRAVRLGDIAIRTFSIRRRASKPRFSLRPAAMACCTSRTANT